MKQKNLERHLRWVILDEFADKSLSEKELILADTEEEWDKVKDDPEMYKLLNLAKAFYNKGVTDSANVDKQSILELVIP